MKADQILSVEEWSFDENAVPPHELRACLIWESARECNELFLAEWASDLSKRAERSRWDQTLQEHVENPPGDREAAIIELEELNFDLDKHLQRLYSSHEAFTRFYDLVLEYARPDSDPWQLLPQDFREYATTQLGKSEVIKPLQAANLGHLEVLWKKNAAELIAIEAGEKLAAYTDTAEMLRYEPVAPVEIPPEKGDPQMRELTVAFTVNFSLYTDNEILEALQVWLKQARICPSPVRRGKKLNDDRAALDGIGMMRALHYFSFNSPEFPQPFKNRGQRACYKGRNLALEKYHEVLPFLPQESFPKSWKTASAIKASKSS